MKQFQHHQPHIKKNFLCDILQTLVCSFYQMSRRVYGCGEVKCYLCPKKHKMQCVHHNNSLKIARLQKETTRPDMLEPHLPIKQ